MQAADEALKKGVAMQYVAPTEGEARENGAPGLLIGPHIPVVVND